MATAFVQNYFTQEFTQIYELIESMKSRIMDANASLPQETKDAMRREFERAVFFIQERLFNPNKQAPELTYFAIEVADLVNVLQDLDQQLQSAQQTYAAGDPTLTAISNRLRNAKDNVEMNLDDILREIYQTMEGGRRKQKKSYKIKKSRKALRKARKTRRR